MLDLQKLIQDVFAPRKGENVIILNDMPSSEKKLDMDFIKRREMAKLWHDYFSSLSKKFNFTVEPIISYEPTGHHNAPLSSDAVQNKKKIDLTKKLSSLGKKDIVVAITRYSATGPLDTLVSKQKFRCASLPGATMDMTAFEADYRLVAKKAKILAGKLSNAKLAHVTFSTGHEMDFDLRNRKAEVDDGICTEPGKTINLPSGEAYIAPYELKASKTQGFIPVYFENHLLIYEIKENKIIDVITDSPKSREMQKYFQDDPARGNIAELGLGCNEKAVFIDNALQDEKIEGMHWAYGYNSYIGGSVKVSDFKDPSNAVHADIIYTKEAKIKVKQIKLIYENNKEEVIMENSRYSFNVLKEFEKS
jgi:leucyl aminopeptidase (aminopeptidase T)